MDIEVLAAKAVKSIAARNAKSYGKKHTAPELKKEAPVRLEGKAYKVGCAVKEAMPADITAKAYWIAGHGPGKRITGVHDPMTVSAMWIGADDAGGIIMVSVDAVGLTNTEVSRIRCSLSDFCKKTNCAGVNICCTHQHAGIDTVGYWGKLPKTGKDEQYMAQLMGAVHDVCVQAYEGRTQGKLYKGTVHVPDAQFDKREPVVLHDVLTRIRFVPDDGSKETWLLNFAAHPNTLGGSNYEVSADYPYYLRQTIYESADVNVLFGVGAIGAVDPGMYCEDKPERTRLQGQALGKAALSIDNDTELEVKITHLCQPFYAPVDNPVLYFLGMLKVMSTARVPCDEGELKVALKTEMTYIELGSLAILLLPGEAFPETVYGPYEPAQTSATGKGPEINPPPLVDVIGNKELLVFGVTNDMTGYSVAPNDFILNPKKAYLNNGRDRFDRSHYHETNSLG